jgi:hypothetical protein
MPVARLIPIEAMPSLSMLGLDDHIWSVLCQAVLVHPERRTRIRDLLTVRRNIKACTEEQLERLMSRIQVHAFRQVFEQILADAQQPVPIRNSTRRVYRSIAATPTHKQGYVRGNIALRAFAIAASDPFHDWRRAALVREAANVRRPILRRVADAALHTAASISALTRF